MAVQTVAMPCSVETGVGTGSWGGTCHVATSAAVDSREQGLETDPDVQCFGSFEELVAFRDWAGDRSRFETRSWLNFELLKENWELQRSGRRLPLEEYPAGMY